MPICQKCNNRFPCHIVIDNKERNLASRKYCLTCSPFGKHNTARLHIKDSPNSNGVDCKCVVCGRIYVYCRKSGHTMQKCNSCLVNARKNNLKKKMVEYKGGECKCCGYHKCLQALEFHHRDPDVKRFNLSGAHCRKWSTIREELDKCDLVCSNCHKEIEAGRH